MAPMTFTNPDSESIRRLLGEVKTIAVLGFSPDPARPSHTIARGLQRSGFRVIAVRPGLEDGLGEKAYPDLAAIPERVDLVDVFRASEHVPQIVDECIRLGVKNLWLQDGVVHAEAAERARAAGITVVMDRCILRDYSRLCRS